MEEELTTEDLIAGSPEHDDGQPVGSVWPVDEIEPCPDATEVDPV